MNLETLINDKGLSIDEFCGRISKQKQTVLKWCEGKKMPRDSTLNLMVRILGKDKDQLIDIIRNSTRDNMIRKCQRCGNDFKKRTESHTYCSKECRVKVVRKMHSAQISSPPDWSFEAQQNNFYDKLKRFGIMRREYTREELNQATSEFLARKKEIKKLPPIEITYENSVIGRILDELMV